MNSVTAMKLIPVSNNETSSVNSFPTISTNEMVIRKQNDIGNLTNLDSELLEILHNKDLSDDAKAKLYWIALHKSEIYKDKSMWSEPTIVELRENRFIPIPVNKPILSNEKSNINRKRKMDQTDNELSNKRKKLNDFSSDLDVNVNIQPSRKRKSDNENEDSDHQLKRMALVNRVQNGEISQEELDREEEKIESDEIQKENESDNIEPDIISGPLVVVNQQDEPQPSTSRYNYTPKEFKISENLAKKLEPEWLKIFYSKIDSDKISPFVQSQIKNIIEKIMEKDPKFKLMGNSIYLSYSKKPKISADPVTLFTHLIHGKSTTTRALDLLKNYLKELKIDFQEGSGFKNKRIKKWVKL